MAKELPYFKFEPGAWQNGNIQMCSGDTKGLFMDLCSIYWERLGEVPYAFALQKLCNGNNDALQELENNQIIGVSEGNIIIEFLDEQLEEFQNTSEKRRLAANKRWSAANALQVQSKSNAIREEKRRKEKKKEDINVPTPDEFLIYAKGLDAYRDGLDYSVKAKYDDWKARGWKDGNNKPIKNWKTKIANTLPYLKPIFTKPQTTTYKIPERWKKEDGYKIPAVDYEAFKKNQAEG